jgi:hypothetical protein
MADMPSQPESTQPAPGTPEPSEEPLAEEPPTIPEPAPEPVPEPVVPAPRRWIVAEVLDVEEASGEPFAVMIEAGEPAGIREGMRGELVEGDVVIGTIEIVDVYPSGSRARIVGPLSAPVSFDTVSRIPLDAPNPPDGE